MYLQVLADEVGRIAVVGVNAADPGGGEKHVVRPRLGEKGIHRRRIGQVQLPVGAGNQVLVALRLEPAEDGGTHQPAVAGDVNPVVPIHGG